MTKKEKSMSITKILYKRKNWDKEVIERKKIEALERNKENIERCIETYINPKLAPNPKATIDDAVSFYDLLGGKYHIAANDYYLLENDIINYLKYMYLFVLSATESYKLEKNGVEITRSNLKKEHDTKQQHDEIMMCAAAIDKSELFKEYGTNIGCEIIKAMFHEDYETTQNLVDQLPETAEIYEKEKYIASYCYESKYLKALYQALLSKDEDLFNKALADRIKFIRHGYVVPVDVVSVTMIKFARKLGLDYNFDVIEIPKALLEDLSDIPFEEYRLPIV